MTKDKTISISKKLEKILFCPLIWATMTLQPNCGCSIKSSDFDDESFYVMTTSLIVAFNMERENHIPNDFFDFFSESAFHVWEENLSTFDQIHRLFFVTILKIYFSKTEKNLERITEVQCHYHTLISFIYLN